MPETAQLPPVTTQRAMLEGERDELRRQGYQAHIQHEVAKVQDLGKEGKVRLDNGQGRVELIARADYLAGLRKKSANAYKAAARMEELLAELPAEEAAEEPAAEEEEDDAAL